MTENQPLQLFSVISLKIKVTNKVTKSQTQVTENRYFTCRL